jgi:uncharacterized protein (TIGR02466 family)
MTQLKTSSFFPTVIGIYTEQELRNKMLPIAKAILAEEKNLTYEWGYKNTYTGYKDGIETLPEMQEFVQFIREIGGLYLDTLGYDYKQINLNPKVFTSAMVKGDMHTRHCHPNSILSGVFYLEVPKGSSPIIFHDPRPFRDSMQLPRKEDNSITSEIITYAPEDGDFVIWESWIHHQVPKNQSEAERITLVFNT